MNAVLIDVGSTFIKYSIYNKEKKLIFFEKTPFPEPMVNDGIRFVVSKSEIFDKILEILKKAKEYHCCVAIFSVQMHGYVAKFYDNTFSDYVSWRDKSGKRNEVFPLPHHYRLYYGYRNNSTYRSNQGLVRI